MKARFLAMSIALVFIFVACASDGGTTPAAGDTAEAGQAAEPAPAAQAAEPAGGDNLPPVTLSMYLMGETVPGLAAVYELLNEKLSAEINATIDVNFISWDNMHTQYSLLLASGQPVDLIFTADWMQFADHARRGGFMELSIEMLERYAPMIAARPRHMHDAGRVDGRLYALVSNESIAYTAVYIVRGDLLASAGMDNIGSLEEYGQFLRYVAENVDGILPVDLKGDNFTLKSIWLNENRLAYINTNMVNNGSLLYSIDDPDVQLMSIFDHEGLLDYFRMVREWQEAGFWARDALARTVGDRESFEAGAAASAISNLSGAAQTYENMSAARPEWDVRVFNAFNNTPLFAPAINAAMSIGATSNNHERALMTLDLLNKNEAFNVLSYSGREGIDFVIENGIARVLPDAPYPPGAAGNWGWANRDFMLTFNFALPNHNEINDFYMNNGIPLPLMSFALDTSAPEISGIVPLIFDLQIQHGQPLALGFQADVEGALAAYEEAARIAGYFTYLEVAQRQIDYYLASLR